MEWGGEKTLPSISLPHEECVPLSWGMEGVTGERKIEGGRLQKKTIGWMTAAAKARETPARFFISKADSFLFPPADFDVELTKTCVSFVLLDSVCMYVCMYGPGSFVLAAFAILPPLEPMNREHPFPQSLFSAGREMERAVMTIRFMAIKTPWVCAIDNAVQNCR